MQELTYKHALDVIEYRSQETHVCRYKNVVVNADAKIFSHCNIIFSLYWNNMTYPSMTGVKLWYSNTDWNGIIVELNLLYFVNIFVRAGTIFRSPVSNYPLKYSMVLRGVAVRPKNFLADDLHDPGVFFELPITFYLPPLSSWRSAGGRIPLGIILWRRQRHKGSN